MDDLPDGVFVTLGEDGRRHLLVWEGRLLAWTPVGYTAMSPLPIDGEQVNGTHSRINRRSDQGRLRAGGPSLGLWITDIVIRLVLRLTGAVVHLID
jgi:hypothetical protein